MQIETKLIGKWGKEKRGKRYKVRGGGKQWFDWVAKTFVSFDYLEIYIIYM